MPSVQRVRFAKFRVVATSLLAVLIFATLVILLTGGTLFRPRSVLYVFVPDATGIAQGSPVRVDGIQVGKVDEVILTGSVEPSRIIRVSMIVDRDRLPSITADSTAQAAADTLIGDKFIQISSGKSSQRVQPGMEIPYKGSPDLVKSLDLSQFAKSLEQMDTLLTDIEAGRNPLGQFIMTDTMYTDLLHRVTELQAGVRAAASTTSAVGRELYTDAFYRQISEPIARIDQTLERLQAGQGTMGQLLRDPGQYDRGLAQIADIRKQIAETRRSPLFTSTADYDSWNRGVQKLIRQVDDFNATPMLATSAVYDNLNGMTREIAGSVSEFRQDPKKFLRLKIF